MHTQATHKYVSRKYLKYRQWSDNTHEHRQCIVCGYLISISHIELLLRELWDEKIRSDIDRDGFWDKFTMKGDDNETNQ